MRVLTKRSNYVIMTIMENTKRYIVSSLITFTTGFLIAIVPLLDTLTVDNVGKSALIGIALAGIRAGIKGLAEWFVLNYGK